MLNKLYRLCVGVQKKKSCMLYGDMVNCIVPFTNNEMAQQFSHRENMIMCFFYSFLVRTLILTLIPHFPQNIFRNKWGDS